MSYSDQYPGDARSSEGAWEKLSRVAVNGAEYNSRERQPHPKCLKETRVDLLSHIYGLLDNPKKSQLIWLHGTAGVGKSAVAFTVAERMRSLKVSEHATSKRLAGTFFFSRKHTKRRTTGYFFATLVYQLASNFPSIRDDINRTIRENPALLDPDKSLEDQTEALFLQPLRSLQLRLRGSPPLVFAIDALDECTSVAETTDLISLLGQALLEPGLPVTHILLTSRTEAQIRNAFHKEEMRSLVCEIPVKISGEGVATIISLDGADVDNDICIFLEHSFKELRSRYPNFPQPKEGELVRLASRAGRRFIVASTMMKFIDDGYNDPRDRLQLMLELTSKLLPGTEMYKLYDRIISTCTDPKRAYLHLSVVAALADPLPISQISELLGPGEGRDLETVLVQLRSVMDIPTDSSLPVNIYHSSVRDYVSSLSNSSLPEVQYITPPHSLLAHSSFRLMIRHLPESTALLDVLSELKRQSHAMQSHDPQNLKHSLAFIIQRPEPLQVLIGLLWLRGDRSLKFHPWLKTLDGCAWLQTQGGRDWLQTKGGRDWLQTRGQHWLQSCGGHDWLQTQGGRDWLQTRGRRQAWSQISGGRDWLQIQGGRDWLQTQGGQNWLQILGGRDWLRTQDGRDWLQAQDGQDWLLTQGGQDWLQVRHGQDWLQTQYGRQWLQTQGEQNHRIQIQREWGSDQLLSQAMNDQHLTDEPEGEQQLPSLILHPRTLYPRLWLWIQQHPDWLETLRGQDWLKTLAGQYWLKSHGGQDWLQIQGGQDWLQI
ncbi:hypothetical protein K503DRAFT_245591 [Rhizopogon vinicolor AM-OR11-026]|uniref:NACHT domain-containing protein n=1 Tax=Rhizopogon vinicolor AM-OR11-026 TaxID=1314800 RepID=A0A1B7MXD7_9AGAM|nr:hypothetical protein K503DRAFT_245591 [Rhizopogon vinicolor AM-OR11-026]